MVTVSDRGPGLSDDLREHVFDKFVRGRAAGVAGTGLGLYISDQIVRAHDGSMHVLARPGGGADFVFELPVRARSSAE